MATINKSVLLPYSAQQMFDLVHDVESYPKFLPWCGGSQIIARDQASISARIKIDYRGVGQSFSTCNRFVRAERIDMHLLDGPFTHLEGSWQFKALGAHACKVEFSLEYKFARGVLGTLLMSVFNYIASSMVDAFVKRAQVIYGGQG